MRYLILSDIHGNWEALDSALRQVRGKDFDATLLLGDLVGYGASPERVLDQLAGLPGRLVVVRGNHDKLVAGIEDGSQFNDAALSAARWTRERLGLGHLETLRELPRGPSVVEAATCIPTKLVAAREAALNERTGTTPHEGGDTSRPFHDDEPALAICHGSPVDEDAYLFSEREAWQAFCAPPEARVTFFGHTHLPSVFSLEGDRVQGLLLRGQKGRLRLRPSARYLINPGSVGQPRDRNPRASFMIYDSDRNMLRWQRVAYPIEQAQERIRSAGLPEALAERLAFGI